MISREEKLEWLKNHLSSCLNEELPTQQGNLSFLPESIGQTKLLCKEPELIPYGRRILTYDLDFFCDTILKDVQTLSKEIFAIECCKHDEIKTWYFWNVNRGRIPL